MITFQQQKRHTHTHTQKIGKIAATVFHDAAKSQKLSSCIHCTTKNEEEETKTKTMNRAHLFS